MSTTPSGNPKDTDREEVLAERAQLRQLVLTKYLSGITTATRIANSLGLPEFATLVERILNTQSFMSDVHTAKRDMATSVIDTIKARLHEYREEMEKLALEPGDPRVKFQALKDLMDRGGTGAAKQISLTSPQSYKKVLDEYKDDSTEAPVETDNPTPRSLPPAK